ncbi:nucleotidyltransferase domain-containing protein [Streptomyces sp. NPDC002773]|uniref:nucleotidyltransferase domain-containing protein n=1 Tax=Streptomyces sp. NPDC002773 TaxID=3154430 RepID=UPI0033205BD1
MKTLRMPFASLLPALTRPWSRLGVSGGRKFSPFHSACRLACLKDAANVIPSKALTTQSARHVSSALYRRISFANSSIGAGMKRERATQLLTDMLDRLEAGGWPLDLADEVYVFGSYARGALEPADVDVVVEHRTDDRLTAEFVHALSYGRDPSGSMKRALKGRSRGIQLQLRQRENLEKDGIPLMLLWRKGEPMAAARARLADLTSDPLAGRAQRDHMIDAFEGLDQWIPRPVRADLAAMVGRKAVTITQLALDGTEPAHPLAQRALTRWSPTSPLRRAASAALAHAETRGCDMAAVHLHGEPLHGRWDTAPDPVFGIGLGWQRYGRLAYLLEDVTEWIEVIRPTRAQPLHALHIIVTDRTALPQP